MTSPDSSQSPSEDKDKSPKTYGELFGKATIDPPPPSNKERGKEQPQPPAADNSPS